MSKDKEDIEKVIDFLREIEMGAKLTLFIDNEGNRIIVYKADSLQQSARLATEILRGVIREMDGQP